MYVYITIPAEFPAGEREAFHEGVLQPQTHQAQMPQLRAGRQRACEPFPVLRRGRCLPLSAATARVVMLKQLG